MLRHKEIQGIAGFGGLFRVACTMNRVIFALSAAAAFVCLFILPQPRLASPLASVTDSTLAIVLLALLGALAAYRKMSRSQRIPAEHPLTTHPVYRMFYDMSPLGGGLMGGLAGIGSVEPGRFFSMTIEGAVGCALLVWLVADPAIGVCEMLMPGSRRLRLRRVAKITGIRESCQKRSMAFLAGLQAEEAKKQEAWREILRDDVEELTKLTLAAPEVPDRSKESRVAEIGAKAYKVGGGECMKYVYAAVEQRCKARTDSGMGLWLVSIWWDGIGEWRSRWIEGECAL